MGFKFDEKPMVEICGKQYECDPADSGLIAGIVRDFPRLLMLGAEFAALDEEAKAAVKEPGKHADYAEKVQAKNEELLQAAQGFIQGCIGVEEYNEIFAGRKPNSAEHISLCTYLYKHIMGQREKVVAEYIDTQEEADAADNATQSDIRQGDRNRVSKMAAFWKRLGRPKPD